MDATRCGVWMHITACHLRNPQIAKQRIFVPRQPLKVVVALLYRTKRLEAASEANSGAAARNVPANTAQTDLYVRAIAFAVPLRPFDCISFAQQSQTLHGRPVLWQLPCCRAAPQGKRSASPVFDLCKRAGRACACAARLESTAPAGACCRYLI